MVNGLQLGTEARKQFGIVVDTRTGKDFLHDVVGKRRSSYDFANQPRARYDSRRINAFRVGEQSEINQRRIQRIRAAQPQAAARTWCYDRWPRA